MKNRKLCRLFAAVLAVAMVAAMIPVSALAGFADWLSGWRSTVAEEQTVETLATGSITQPFASGTQGSTYFRIPAIVTLDDGTIVAAADARWSATTDGGGLDTIVAYSKDNGATWKSSLANYLGDNGNTHNKASTTFIDPALATDGNTVYMLVDLFPSGYSNTTSATNYLTETGSGFNSDGKLKLCAANSSSYNYYLGEFDSEGYAYIYNKNGDAVSNYKVDQWFNIYNDGAESGNLFYTSSAYHVYTTQYLYLTKSTDGGVTWSAPTLINVKEEQECFYGVCPGSGCITKDGTIIFMCYGCKTIGEDLRASYIYSKDGGKTWNRSWNRDTLTFQNTSSEASVTEVEVNGKTYLYMFTRYYGSPTIKGAYYFSDDGGATWTAKTDINYTCGSDMGVITYSQLINGKPAMLLSAHSSSGRNSGVIYTITVEENGDLKCVKTYSVNGSSYYAYSDLTELSDGSIGLLYESKDGSVTFEKIDIRDIVGTDATITEPDTGTTEPEEPTPDATVEDDNGNTGISVIGPGLTAVEIKTHNIDAELRPEDVTEVEAYDITPYVGEDEYHGSATVTFPLPDGWDTARIKGFVLESNGTYNWELNATVSGETVSVEFPHFSVGGIYLAAEAGSGDGDVTDVTVTEEKEITLTVGADSGVYRIEGAYYTTATANPEGIVTWELGGAEEVPASIAYNKATNVSRSSLISSNSSSWTKPSTEYYYTPDGTNYYPLYVKRSSSWTNYTYTYGYSITDSANDVEEIATESNGILSGDTVGIDLYTKTGTEGTPAYTTVTFHAVAPGTTSVVVGNTWYNITVNKRTTALNVRPGYTVTLENAGTKITAQPDTTFATAKIENGTLTITGVTEGSTTMETDLYIITIDVADIIYNKNSLVSANDVSFNSYNSIAAGDEITGLLLSYSDAEYNYGTTSFNLKSGSSVNITGVQVKDGEAASATLNTDGTVTVTGANVGSCVIEVTFADGSITKIPVRVVQGAESDSYKLEQVYYFDAMYHSEVYYAVGTGNYQVDTDWTKACEGYAFHVQLHAGTNNNAQGSVILLAAKPDDGYAVSTVVHSTTNNSGSWAYGDGAYHFIGSSDNEKLRFGSDFTFAEDGTVSNVNGITSGKASYYFDYCYTKKGVVNQNDDTNTAFAYSMSNFETLLNNAADDGLLVGFLYSVPVALRLQVISDKLPTMEKSIKKVNGKSYSEEMIIGLGDKITYTLTFTSYHTHKSTFSNAQEPTISYSNVKYTDELTGDIATALTGGLTKSEATQSSATFESNPEELPMAQTKEVDVTFTLTMDTFDKVKDGKLENIASATYDYEAFQSKGSSGAVAKAEAVSCKIATPTYIVDFGLPVELDLSSALGGATITGATTTQATATPDGAKLTYTATKPISGEDYVGLELKASNGGKQYYGVTIIPASNVLYEENFLTAGAGWEQVGTALNAKQSNQLAKADGIYGYDDAYKSSTGSNGYYQFNNLATGKMSTALTTTFTGTGFDLIGDCGPTTGRLMIDLIKDNKHKIVIVDTRYNGTDGDEYGVLHQVPLAHMMVEEGTYEVKIFASGTAASTADSASAVSAYSVNRKSIATVDPFERYLRENNITDVEYFTMSNGLTASVQSVSAASTYAAQAVTLEAGTHMEIDAFRVYYSTDNDNYNTAEKNVQYVNILEAVDGATVEWWTENGEYNGEVDQYEANGGPQNEIYLSSEKKAVIFDIENVDTIQVSLRSVDGKSVSVNNGALIESSTEMYYTLTKVEGGAFTIVNTGEGILGIGNIKVSGDSGETAILTASELEPEVVSYSLRMALTVEPDQPEEPEQPEVFLPQSFDASCRSVNVLRNKLVTVSVTASTDVAYITVNGQKVNAWNNVLGWIYQPDTLRFTFTDLIKRGESKTYEIVAYNADGVASAVYTVQG